MQVSFKINKAKFLDREAVENIVGKEYAKFLTKAGSYTRQDARRRLKVSKRVRSDAEYYKQNQPSPPGKAPRSWSEHPTASLRNIQYQFDAKRMSIFIGPIGLNSRVYGGFGAVTGAHEHGGTLGIPEWRFTELGVRNSWPNWRKFRGVAKVSTEWRRGRVPKGVMRSKIAHESRLRTANYPARPFMGPALKKTLPKFPSLFGRST